MDEIRDYYKAHAATHATPLATSYFGAGYPGIAQWTLDRSRDPKLSATRFSGNRPARRSFDGVD